MSTALRSSPRRGGRPPFAASPILVGLLPLLACGPPPPTSFGERHPLLGRHDVEYSATHTFRVGLDPERRHVTVSQRASLTVTPLGAWTLGRTWWTVFVPWHSAVSEIQAQRNGRPVPASHVLDTVPTLENIFLHTSRELRVFAPPRRLGEPLRLRYTRAFRDVRFLPLLQVPNVDYLRRFEVVVHHPASVHLTLHQWVRDGARLPAFVRTTSGDRATSRLVLENLQALPPRPWDPLPGPRAVFWLTLADARGPLHPVAAKDFARWMRGLYDRTSALGSASQALVRRLIAGLASERERARALYDFVRKEVRYVADERGLGAIAPRPAETVLRRRWGDCKDKANLLLAMGRLAGLTVDPVLVATEPRPRMKGVWHPGMFNHAIAAVRVDGERIFVDPTASTVPFGRLPLGVQEAQAFVLHPEAPAALRLPAGSEEPSLSGEITVSPGGLERGRARITLREPFAAALAGLALRQEPARIAGKLRALLGALLPELRFENVHLLRTSAEAVALEADVDVRRVVVKAGDRLHVLRTPRSPCPAGLGARQRDGAPLYLPPGWSLELALLVPAAPYLLERGAPVRRQVPGIAWFDSSVERQGSWLRVVARQGRRRRFLAGSARNSFLRHCEAAGTEAREWITLRRAF